MGKDRVEARNPWRYLGTTSCLTWPDALQESVAKAHPTHDLIESCRTNRSRREFARCGGRRTASQEQSASQGPCALDPAQAMTGQCYVVQYVVRVT